MKLVRPSLDWHKVKLVYTCTNIRYNSWHQWNLYTEVRYTADINETCILTSNIRADVSETISAPPVYEMSLVAVSETI